MKKRTRRLSLVRETLGNLEDHNLRRIAGGTFGTSLECIEATGCECATQGCGGTASMCNTMTVCSNC